MPKLIWKLLTKKDCCEQKLTTVDPQERSTWRSGVRSPMRAASQLPGRGPTDVDDAPAPALSSKIRLCCMINQLDLSIFVLRGVG